MLDENQTGQADQEKSVLDNPVIAQEEALLKPEAVKKSKAWVFKLILILVIIGVVLYLFMNPEIMTDPVNKFFNRFS